MRTPVTLEESYFLPGSDTRKEKPSCIIVLGAGRKSTVPCVEFHYANLIEVNVDLLQLFAHCTKVSIIDYTQE